MENSFKEFIDQSVHQLELNLPRIKKCLDMLDEIQVWRKPNESTNSVANLILHLCGNITQYIHSGLGGEQDIRMREAEFVAGEGYSKAQLYEKIVGATEKAVGILKNIGQESLLRKRVVQGFSYSGIGIIIHVTEHYSYHVGQIAFWTKLLKNNDLGFYKDFDLDIKNEGGVSTVM